MFLGQVHCPAIPATKSALRFRPRIALPSAWLQTEYRTFCWDIYSAVTFVTEAIRTKKYLTPITSDLVESRLDSFGTAAIVIGEEAFECFCLSLLHCSKVGHL